MHVPYKQIICSALIATLVIGTGYSFIEPSFVSAQTSATDTVQVSLTVDSGITITAPANVTMAPNIGISANSSIGTVLWNVKTNDGDGYTLAVKASTSPAMKAGSDAFADYTEATSGTPDVWSVGAGTFEFGYSAFGTDVPTATWGTGANCGSAGTPTGTLKYDGFTTTNRQIGTRTATTTTSGVDTTVCFAAAQNGVYAPAGTYTADITATATVI